MAEASSLAIVTERAPSWRNATRSCSLVAEASSLAIVAERYEELLPRGGSELPRDRGGTLQGVARRSIMPSMKCAMAATAAMAAIAAMVAPEKHTTD